MSKKLKFITLGISITMISVLLGTHLLKHPISTKATDENVASASASVSTSESTNDDNIVASTSESTSNNNIVASAPKTTAGTEKNSTSPVESKQAINKKNTTNKLSNNTQNTPDKHSSTLVKAKQTTIQKTANETRNAKTYVDYSTFTGSWFCKDKSTSLYINVDSNGFVAGSIVSVVGSHVPASHFRGKIENGTMVIRIDSDGLAPGTLTLSFIDANILKGNVKLDDPNSYFTIAQGDMLFEKYSDNY